MKTWRNIEQTWEQFNEMMQAYNSFVVFDTETTGLNPNTDKIIQLSANKISRDFEVLDTFDTLINPYPNIILPKITELTGITYKMVADAPTEKVVISQFNQWSEDCGFFAYNSDFDAGMYQGALSRVGLQRTIQHFDVLGLARDVVEGPENYKLATVADYLKVIPENANFHNSMFDVEMTLEVLKKCVPMLQQMYRERSSVQNSIRPKVYGLNPWERGKQKRIYIPTSVGSVYYDKINKRYGAGTAKEPLDINTLDMEYVEEQVLRLVVKGGFDSLDHVTESVTL